VIQATNGAATTNYYLYLKPPIGSHRVQVVRANSHHPLGTGNPRSLAAIPTWVRGISRPGQAFTIAVIPCAGVSDWFNVAVLVERSVGIATLRLRFRRLPTALARGIVKLERIEPAGFGRVAPKEKHR
jgi:hypothetical protein